jgi:hypothetical protein
VTAVTAVRTRALGVPVWLWLGAVVVCSVGVRLALGHQVVAPWIMVDELVYSELAKSFAATGHFDIRGVPSNGYGFVYPALIAPAWRLFGAMPTVYGAAKAINAVVMSLAAVPAYFLARRLLSTGLALVAAVLTVLVPSMLYTGTLMTENAFYPLFLVVCLALVATLQRPTAARQVGLLALCGLAYATRQQAIALLPAVAVAPALHGLIERDVRRRSRAWLPLYAILAAGAVVVLAATVARGRSPLTLLGAYRAATSVPYSARSVLHYLLWHVAELDLYVGVIPFAALLALWLAPRAASPAARAFAAATFPVTLFLLVEVALFASTQSERIEERNTFYLAPFALVALVGLAERDVVPRAWRALVPAALAAGALPAAIPFSRFVNPSAVSDTFALLPWWWVQDRGIHFDTLRLVALGAGLAAAALFVLVPRRFALVLPLLVAAYFGLTTAVVQNGRHGIRQAAVGKLWAGIKVAHPDWVDRAVGRAADVTQIWAGVDVESVWENEFFNRSIRRVVHVGDHPDDVLPATEVRERSDGVLVRADGSPLRVRYALVPSAPTVAGRTVASDQGTGLRLVRVDGPVVVLTKVSGLYPGDVWSRRRVTYTHRRCGGGYVSVVLQEDQSLFTTDQVVTATAGGKVVGQIRVPPDGEPHRFLVPLASAPGRLCTASFTVAKLRVPAQVEPGSSDTRPLGIRFLSFDYLP